MRADDAAPPGATQQRGIETRARLIDAAILCLTRHGFAGTTMARVSNYAKVSTGPRQYYFPNRDDLFVAVVEELFRRQSRLPISDDADLIGGVIDNILHHAGSREHIAMLEIKLALKHEVGLRDRIGPVIAEQEALNDKMWSTRLEDHGYGQDDKKTLRLILPAIARGMAFDPMPNEEQRAAIVSQVKQWYALTLNAKTS